MTKQRRLEIVGVTEVLDDGTSGPERFYVRESERRRGKNAVVAGPFNDYDSAAWAKAKAEVRGEAHE